MMVGFSSFFSSMTTRIPSRSLSSLRSEIPSIFFSLTSSAIFSTSLALFTWYGISVTTMDWRSVFFWVSICTLARIWMMPRPVE